MVTRIAQRQRRPLRRRLASWGSEVVDLVFDSGVLWFVGIVVILAAITFLIPRAVGLRDRGGQEGSYPDKISDVDYVEVYRNADNFPNLAYVCVRGVAFFATASHVASEEKEPSPSLLRAPAKDADCAARSAAIP